MIQKTIKNFNYKGETNKVSNLIKKEYPEINLSFDNKNNELTIYCSSKYENKLLSVYSMLLTINIFNLQK